MAEQGRGRRKAVWGAVGGLGTVATVRIGRWLEERSGNDAAGMLYVFLPLATVLLVAVIVASFRKVRRDSRSDR